MVDSSMPWIKLFTDFLDDPKIGQLSDAIKLRFVQILLIAGECDADGALVIADTPMTQAHVSWRLRVDVSQLAQEMSALKGVGVLSEDEGIWSVVNFAKRQGRSQSEKRLKWREWQQSHRAKKQPDTTNVMPDSALTQAGVRDKEGEKSKSKRESKSRESTAQAPSPSGAKNPPSEPGDGKTESKSGRPRDPLFDAVAAVTSSNPRLLGKRIAKCANDLKQICATPDQVYQVARWYAQNDWRGKKGEKLTFAVLAEVWDSGIKNLPVVSTSTNGHAPAANEPAGFAAIREAMKDPKYKE